jgi:hypothetical protein
MKREDIGILTREMFGEGLVGLRLDIRHAFTMAQAEYDVTYYDKSLSWLETGVKYKLLYVYVKHCE